MASFNSSIRVITIFLGFISFLFLFAQGQSVPAVYVFGDSIVDVGNNQHIFDNLLRVDFPYYGIDYPSGPTGRFCNGKNAADWLAEKVGLPTSPPPYLSNTSDIFPNGVSFASGGSGLFNTTGQGFFVKTLSLATQVDYYTMLHERLVKQLGTERAEEQLSKSLFLVVTGNNDIFRFFASGNSYSDKVTPRQYIDDMISILQGLLKQLHSLGARKFVMVGLGSIGCCPVNRLDSSTEDCNQDMNNMAMNYNKNLKSMLGGLKSDLYDFNYSYFDTYTYLLGIIQNPATYGFKEAKAACCGSGKLNAEGLCVWPLNLQATYCPNRTDHVFWDKYHPTETAAGLLVDAIYNGTQPEVSPINVEQLIALIALTTLSSL